MIGKLAIVDAETLENVGHQQLGLGLLQDARTVRVVLIPYAVDALLQYHIDIDTFLAEREKLDSTTALFLRGPWHTLVKHEARLGDTFNVVVPVTAEFLVHFVIEKLLLSPLSPEHLLHVQTALLHYFVKHCELSGACILLVLLESLHALNLGLLLEVTVLLGHLLLDLLS